jgi:hypothetical protein
MVTGPVLLICSATVAGSGVVGAVAELLHVPDAGTGELDRVGTVRDLDVLVGSTSRTRLPTRVLVRLKKGPTAGKLETLSEAPHQRRQPNPAVLTSARWGPSMPPIRRRPAATDRATRRLPAQGCQPAAGLR